MKKNLSLILALALPLLLIAIIAVSIYIPRGSVNPQQDFVYMVEDEYYGSTTFTVVNKKLQKITEERSPKENVSLSADPKLYIHDVQNNQSREASYDEAAVLNLDTNLKSQDGYQVIEGGSHGGFLPFSSSSYGKFFIKNESNASKKLNLLLNSSNYYRYHFLGWIKE